MKDQKGFASRVLERIGRADPRLIEAALQQLLSQRQLLEVIFENLQEGLIVTDPQLMVLVCNARARRWLGIAANRRVTGESLLSLIRAPEIFEFVTAKDFSKAGMMERDFRLSRPENVWLQLTSYPVEESGGRINAIVFVLRDVTDARRAEIQQRQAERIASLTTLTAGIAHDLKNPLNSLQIHAQLADRMIGSVRTGSQTVDLDRLEGSLKAVLEETHRITRIVNDFLNAVRPTDPEKEEVDLRRIIGETLATFRKECEEKAIALRQASDPDLPPILLDPEQVVRAISGILRNAIEAIEEKRETESDDESEPLRSDHDWISVDCRIEGDDAVIEIADSGCGIAKENLNKVFEPYFTTKFSGSGLGLMNVYRIVREHDGRVEIDSDRGAGTRVRLRLPLAQRPIRLLAEEPANPPHRDTRE